MATYLTSTEAEGYIGATAGNDSTLIGEVLEAVSRLIDQHCGRTFSQDGTGEEPVARVFDTRDGYCVNLGPFNDLVSASLVKTDENGDGTFETTVTNYQLGPIGTRGPYSLPYTKLQTLNGTTLPTYAPSGRLGLVQITGIWGWAEVPYEVRAACRILVAEIAKLKDAPFGIAGSDQFGMFRVPTQLPPRVRQMLAPLVHPDWVGIG